MIVSSETNPCWGDILVCPACRGKIRPASGGTMACSRCASLFAIVRDIPVMIPSGVAERRSLAGKETSELEPWREKQHEIDACRGKPRDETWLSRQFISPSEFTTPGDGFLVEIGPGPIPRLQWLQAKIRLGIDALAERYEEAFEISRAFPVNFLAAHTESLPLADGAVDAVLCVNALDHVGNMSLTLSEIWRVLKPEGLFFLGVLFDSSPLLCEEPHVVDREFLETELHPNFSVDAEARDALSKDEPPLGFYRARLRKKNAAYRHRFTPAQYAGIGEFFRNFTEGMSLDYRGRFAEARAAFQKALDYPGYHASDRFRLAYCSWRAAATTPDFSRAIEETRERHHQHAFLEAAYKMGSTHKRMDELEKSAAIFGEVLALTERLGFGRLRGGAHFHLGEIALRRGQGKDAAVHFESAIRFIPDHQKAKIHLHELQCRGSL